MADFDSEKDLVIATSASRVLVRIKVDGTLTYGPEYTPDEAATVLWEAVARRRAEAGLKELLYLHMEKVLTEAGEADLANQIAQDHENQLATNPGASKADKMKAHLEARAASETLNQAAVRAVELGRRLALRGAEDPVSEPPLKPGSALN